MIRKPYTKPVILTIPILAILPGDPREYAWQVLREIRDKARNRPAFRGVSGSHAALGRWLLSRSNELDALRFPGE